MNDKRFSKIAGILEASESESNFQPGTPRKLSLMEAFDDYDLSHDKLRRSDIEDEDEDPVIDSESDGEMRHLHRLSKSMGIQLDRDERGLTPIQLVDKRLQKLADVISGIDSQSDRMVSDPWDDYIDSYDATSLLNRHESRVGDAVHLIIRFQPDSLEDIIQYFDDCRQPGGELSAAASRVMDTGTRGNRRGIVFHILNREKIKRSPATGALSLPKKIDEAFVRSMIRSQMIDKLNE